MDGKKLRVTGRNNERNGKNDKRETDTSLNHVLLGKLKKRVKNSIGSLQKTDGIGIVEIILILTVLLVLVIIFRSQLVSFFQHIVQRIAVI